MINIDNYEVSYIATPLKGSGAHIGIENVALMNCTHNSYSVSSLHLLYLTPDWDHQTVYDTATGNWRVVEGMKTGMASIGAYALRPSAPVTEEFWNSVNSNLKC